VKPPFDSITANLNQAAHTLNAWRGRAAELLVSALHGRRTACVAAAALVATGCAPSALVNEWKNVGYAGRPFERVLVLTASSDPEIRRVYEDAFVQELAAMGVTATAAHAVIQADGEVPSERILQAIGEVRADAVLVTRMIGKERRASSYAPLPLQPGTKAQFYAVYQAGMTTQTSPPDGYQVYSLETSLWNATDEALVWFSTSQTFQPASAPGAAKDLADVVVKALRQQQLL
jgi:hypothetical protein